MPGDGFNREALAAIMGAIVNMETGDPSLRDQINRSLSPLANLFGYDATTGIVKLRPSTVMEIYNCEIPLSSGAVIRADLSPAFITKDDMREKILNDPDRLFAAARRGYNIKDKFVRADIVTLSGLLQNHEFALDMLGANLKRGIIRAKAEGLKPSVLNLSTWHNRGTQHPAELLKRGWYGYGVAIAMRLLDLAAEDLGISLPAKINRYNRVPGDPQQDEQQLVDKCGPSSCL
jgi:hypothetical protein